MKRKCYDIWRMFRLNVIENVFSIRFFVITLLLCILFIFSQFDVVYGMEEGKFMGYSDIIGLFINVMHYDRFKPLMIILLSGIFTTEFCKEWISHFDRFILTRCSVRGYIYGKILGNVVAIYSSMAIAVTAFILFFHFYVKLDIIDFTGNGYFTLFSQYICCTCFPIYQLLSPVFNNVVFTGTDGVYRNIHGNRHH